MSASSLTPTLLLPQFEDTDKPSWLGDFNQAMKKIDNAITVRDANSATQVVNHNTLAAQVATMKATANLLIQRVNVLDTTNPDLPLLP